jgi:hypothetical protein
MDLVIQRGDAYPYHHWFGQGLTTPAQEARKLADLFATGRLVRQRPFRDSVSRQPETMQPVVPGASVPSIAVPVSKPVVRTVQRSRAVRVAIGRRRR